MASWQFFLGGVEVDEPIGFDKIEFSAKRLEGHGIDQAFSTEIQFIGRAAKILKSYFDQHYINEPLTFDITSDVNINGSNYIFSGYINFAIYSEERTCDQPGWIVTVGILEDNFREKFLARQDAELDLTRTQDLEGNAIPALTYQVLRIMMKSLSDSRYDLTIHQSQLRIEKEVQDSYESLPRFVIDSRQVPKIAELVRECSKGF